MLRRHVEPDLRLRLNAEPDHEARGGVSAVHDSGVAPALRTHATLYRAAPRETGP